MSSWVLLGTTLIAAALGILLGRQAVRGTRAFYAARQRRRKAMAAAREAALRAERERISRDLHDQLGAHLTEIARVSGNSRLRLNPSDATALDLQRIETTAGKLVGDLAEIVWLTQPSNNALERFVPYLMDQTTALADAAELSCELDVPEILPAISLDFEVRRDVWLAVKEALHNAIKHARATRIEFSLQANADGLEIGVRDDGVGLPTDARQRPGHGLDHLRLRLERHGGHVTFEPAHPGTRVRFHLPFPVKGPSKRPMPASEAPRCEERREDRAAR